MSLTRAHVEDHPHPPHGQAAQRGRARWHDRQRCQPRAVISDAGIASNVNHVQFSTYAGNVFSSFAVYDIAGVATKRLTWLGDSISTFNYGYQLIVANTYNYGVNTLANHAVSGARIIDDMPSQVTAAASDNADIIVIEFGTNDDDPLRSTYETQLNALKASNANAHIYCLSILNRTPDNNRLLKNPRIQTACANAGVTFWDTEGWFDPSDNLDGGTHPDAAHNQKIAAQVLARLA